MQALIAFGKKPRPGFLDHLVKVVKEDGVNITGAVLCPGPGCANLALIVDLEEKEATNFINQLTMALMPAKWKLCEDPRLKVGEFITEDFE